MEQPHFAFCCRSFLVDYRISFSHIEIETRAVNVSSQSGTFPRSHYYFPETPYYFGMSRLVVVEGHFDGI